MSTVLDILRSSGGADCEIHTLEVTCSAWADPLLICNQFFDFTGTTEDGRTLTFIATAFDPSLPKRDNSGAQTLGVAIDNVTGEAQRRIDQANEAAAPIRMTLRTFLESDPSAPAEPPLYLDALAAEIEGPTIQFTAGYFDLIDTAWPRFRYTDEFSPGVKYIT